MPNLISDIGWLYEEVVRLFRIALPRPGEINHGIDHQKGDVHAFGPHFSRHRLGQDALRSLRRRETCKTSLAADGRCVASYNYCALPRSFHFRARNATSSWTGRPQKSLSSCAFVMLVETFSLMNIVESGKYSRGNCDSKPGSQAPYSTGSGSIIIAHPPVLVNVSNKSESSAAFPIASYRNMRAVGSVSV